MMTQQLGFSILSAPLAAIDRRVLSQAWYSALHLERETPKALPTTQPRTVAPPSAKTAPTPTQSTAGANISPVRNFGPKPEARARVVADSERERRSARSPLARRIERALLNPMTAMKGATLHIDGTKSRVQISLIGSGNRIRLVALCGADVRHTVARALAQARYALALRGVALDVSTREMATCS